MGDTKIPSGRDALIAFYKEHQPIWDTNAAALGLDPVALEPFKEAVDAAVLALGAASSARNASKLATDELNIKAEKLRPLGSSVVATIRAYAEFTGDENVYSIAQLSPPAPPKPAGPPTPPTNLLADPTANGHIILKWKGTTAQGQFFIIERSVDGGPWVRMEPVAAKTWTDLAVPRNTNVIQYQVWGARFDKRSATAPQATVNFGTVDAAIAAAFRSGPADTQAA